MNDDKLAEEAKRIACGTYSCERITKTLTAIRDHAYSVGYKHGKEDDDYVGPGEEDGLWSPGWKERSGEATG